MILSGILVGFVSWMRPAFDDRGLTGGVVDCRRDYSHDTDQRLVSMERSPLQFGGSWMGSDRATTSSVFSGSNLGKSNSN